MDSSYEPRTADGLAELRRARERFLADHVVPDDLPAWLAAAWRRVLFHEVDVERPEVPAARTPPRPRPALLAAARPVLAHLGETLHGLGVAVVLSDARGRIIDCWSDDRTRRHLEAIDTRPGADLAEDSTGINALNHVIATGRPVLVSGPQHLFGLYQDTACAGAPVRDPLTNKIEAAVALVSQIDAPTGLLESLAITATDSIQRELLHQASARERHLFEAYLAARGSGDPVAAFDGRTRLISDAAAALLRPQDVDLLETHAAEFVVGSHRTRHELTINETGLHAALDPVPGADGEAGVLIRLTPDAAPPQSPGVTEPTLLRDAGLVGGASDWRALEHAAAIAARAPGPILVHGERGTGKTVVARAVIGHLADRAVVTVEVCDHPDSTVIRALQEIDEHAPLIVRHAERIPAALVHSTADVLHARAGRSAITLITDSECDETLSAWRSATATTTELAVPPLRDRGADISALIDHVAAAAGLQLTQDGRSALRRYTWPGNVAELEHLMTALRAPGAGRAGRGTNPIAMADLPGHVLCPHRHLGEMEKAERDAVVAALAATGGNKKRAASRLGVSRATLYRKIRAFDIE